ncbi:hypothetical protein PR048_011219 [Dryococelus australis]|uniref:Uncharacterized protein n=1 Tax=Dryococelus australis TaxID=614101 RepID=A0ABQ9HM97_9NEOP|nr:hypothetical protein PR048_011219 [Dryococelus australis]
MVKGLVMGVGGMLYDWVVENISARTSHLQHQEDYLVRNILKRLFQSGFNHPRGEKLGKESAIAFVRDPSQHSPEVILGNHGKPKSGWPYWESNPRPPERESGELPLHHLARFVVYRVAAHAMGRTQETSLACLSEWVAEGRQSRRRNSGNIEAGSGLLNLTPMTPQPVLMDKTLPMKLQLWSLDITYTFVPHMQRGLSHLQAIDHLFTKVWSGHSSCPAGYSNLTTHHTTVLAHTHHDHMLPRPSARLPTSRAHLAALVSPSVLRDITHSR